MMHVCICAYVYLCVCMHARMCVVFVLCLAHDYVGVCLCVCSYYVR